MKSSLIQDNNTAPLRPLILYHCGHEICKTSHSFGPAIRPHYLIHFVLRGHGTYYVNGITYHVGEGEGFLIYPGITTYYEADEQDPWEYCWIGFDGYDVAIVLQNCGMSQTSLVFSDLSNGSLWNDFMKLNEMFTQRTGNEFTLLSQLYLCFSKMQSFAVNSTKLIYENYMIRALNYIHHNYTYDIRIADLADYLCIDRTYLYKLFMTHAKVSPQQYLITYRLEISQKLLKDTVLSVTEIAYSCGFRDTPSFNKHFKKQFKITPLQYRNNFGVWNTQSLNKQSINIQSIHQPLM